MNTKFALSIAALGLIVACSDDSSPSVPENNTNPTPSDTVQIPSETPGDILPGDVLPSDTLPLPEDTVVTPIDTIIPPADTLLPPPVTPVDPTSYTYYGAELTGLDQFKYGRFEARMKMVSIPGSVSSMFLYYDDSWKKEEIPWNEIDIEVLGKSKTSWQANIITRVGDPAIKKNGSSETKPEFGFDATEDFHLYAMVWTPEYVSWEIDSVEVRRDTLGGKSPKIPETRADADQVAFLTEQQSLRFNLWVSKSTTWVGKFTGEELANGPQEQLIDYVRVYSYDEASKTFKQEWQDDFEGNDLSEHWATGNWEMERVMLNPQNVVVEDGLCKLRLTREAE